MKRIALLLILLSGTTLACAQNLSGPYVGGYLAGGSADAQWDFSNGTKAEHSMSGGLVGVQGGYNWLPGGWLLGVQADIGVGNLDGSSRCPPPNQAFECKTELLSLLTVRGRAGPALGNVAPYVTAGIASAGIRTEVNNPSSKDDDLQGHAGWTAGVGITGLISRHILWQAEYLRLNFGSEEHVMFGSPNQVKVTADIVRIGVHYKF